MLRALIAVIKRCRQYDRRSLTRTLQTLQQYTCEGKTMLISCPASTVISVQYAKFGRSVPSARMCPAGDTLTSPALMSEVMLAPGYRVTAAEDTNCLAIRSLEVLLELCEHQPRCQVRAESTTFRQDPCPATSKYLEVHYKCRPNDFQRQTVCEGEQMEIGCGKALRIAVYSAMFGRAPNGSVSCPSDRPGYFVQTTFIVTSIRVPGLVSVHGDGEQVDRHHLSPEVSGCSQEKNRVHLNKPSTTCKHQRQVMTLAHSIVMRGSHSSSQQQSPVIRPNIGTIIVISSPEVSLAQSRTTSWVPRMLTARTRQPQTKSVSQS
ncbi:hypothetical protein C0Q70_10790 [Pomacea canaliculata]|uniref:SUEL-type lectin domain-containing protein n=1 Tax=Pomacea canaliculata TaxID=400727 RepID=A0A2T7P475_POMCA|nr:hypothetical protein C0Q70_10790 [Pomacea canaliculata]